MPFVPDKTLSLDQQKYTQSLTKIVSHLTNTLGVERVEEALQDDLCVDLIESLVRLDMLHI